MKIAIVGGGIRGKMYAESLRPVHGVTVEAVCDLSAKSADELAQSSGAQAFTDHRTMFAECSLDAVIIATPDFAHRDIAVDAAEAGLHMLVEKPLATTSEDAAAIAAAVEKAGVQCLVGFENRWNPSVRQIAELSHSGELGDVLTQSLTLSNTYFVPMEMLAWAARSDPAWFLMSHTVDVALWTAGKRPVSVFASGSRGQLAARGVDTWDVIHAVLSFEDGTTANFTSTWVLPESSPSIVDFTYEAIGTSQSASMNLRDQSVAVTSAESYSQRGLLGGPIGGRLQGPPTWMVQEFVQGLMDGTPVGPGVDQGVLVTEIVLAIHASLESGKPESINA